MLLEAEVHSSLRGFLREQEELYWPHHLTMARLVSRALRLGRSALIQTGSLGHRYALSYLTPALLSQAPVLVVAPTSVQQRLLSVEIPKLQQGLATNKEIQWGDRFPVSPNFRGLFLTSPKCWLADRLEQQQHFPPNITTVIDPADDLEEWTRQQLTNSLNNQDWEQLCQLNPQQAEQIRDVRVQLTKAIYSHPQNPYDCYLLEQPEQDNLRKLLETLALQARLSSPMQQFWQRWQTEEQMIWASLSREMGQFVLHITPAEVATALTSVWPQQPIVLIGRSLDSEKNAPIYRQQLGLGDLLCLKFSPNRQSEHIQLYLPEGLPMPNTPQFQAVMTEQVHSLVNASSRVNSPVVVLVDDFPLKNQVGATLAAQFGSRVQVERTGIAQNGILVSGWEFWHVQQESLPTPQLLIIATLPIPSLENPLVAGRVAYHKRQHQDWFRFYLLPTAVREIQRAVMPLRESQGVVALLDNRVNHRSYGPQILTALEPCARINYLDPTWFT